jgi:hypothetical protein
MGKKNRWKEDTMGDKGGRNREEELLMEIRESLENLNRKMSLVLEKMEIPYPPVENGHPGMSIGKGTL